MKIDDNKLKIDNFENFDYFGTNTILKQNKQVDTLIIADSTVNLEDIANLIDGTYIQTICFKDSFIVLDNNKPIDVLNLVLDNVSSSNYEFINKFINLKNLAIRNYSLEFDCYYLRKLSNLEILSLTNINPLHLGGLGYINTLKTLYLDNVAVKNWIFLTKIINLSDVYLKGPYDMTKIPKLLFNIHYEE